MIAVPVLAQQESMGVLKGNPYRDVGGSCVYGGKGELLHAPKGVSCPTREDAPGGRASRTADEFAGLPPELRSEANALISSHKHIADHLVELRRAIATNDETKGLTLEEIETVLSGEPRAPALAQRAAAAT